MRTFTSGALVRDSAGEVAKEEEEEEKEEKEEKEEEEERNEIEEQEKGRQEREDMRMRMNQFQREQECKMLQ